MEGLLEISKAIFEAGKKETVERKEDLKRQEDFGSKAFKLNSIPSTFCNLCLSSLYSFVLPV